MSKPKGRHLKDGTADMGLFPEIVELVDQFPEHEISEQCFTYLVGEARVVQRWKEHDGKVIWFAFMCSLLVYGQWWDVLRVDTCDGEAHIHRFGRDGTEQSRQHLCSVSTIADVDKAWDHACDLVFDQSDENLRRWANG